MKKLLLCGYMGCGKSTVGGLLSSELGIPSLDLDAVIEQKEGLKIAEIFSKKGEVYFRKIESQAFRDLMAQEGAFVLSLGGGTPAYANNHELLKGEGVKSFFLKASIDTLYDRLIHEKHVRPLIAEKSEEEMKEFIAKHLFDRNYYYLQSDKTINVDAKSPYEVAAEVLKALT